MALIILFTDAFLNYPSVFTTTKEHSGSPFYSVYLVTPCVTELHSNSSCAVFTSVSYLNLLSLEVKKHCRTILIMYSVSSLVTVKGSPSGHLMVSASVGHLLLMYALAHPQMRFVSLLIIFPSVF